MAKISEDLLDKEANQFRNAYKFFRTNETSISFGNYMDNKYHFNDRALHNLRFKEAYKTILNKHVKK